MEDFLKDKEVVSKSQQTQSDKRIFENLNRKVSLIDVPELQSTEDKKIHNRKIEVISEDNIIKTIQITCSCGQQIELECEYLNKQMNK